MSLTFTGFHIELQKSLFEISFYQSLQSKSIKSSLWYLYQLILFIIVLYAISFTPLFIATGISLSSHTQSGFSLVKNVFPNGLVITIKDGNLRSNVDEPYYVDLPKTIKKDNSNTHFIAIDTKNTYTRLEDYRSQIVMTKSTIYILSDNNAFQAFSLKEMTGYTILNKEVFTRILNSLQPYLPYIPLLYCFVLVFALFIFPGILAFFYLLGILCYLLFFSYVFYIFFKNRQSFKSIFHISLHAISASLIFQLIQVWLHISVIFMFALPFIIWMLYILKNISQDEYHSHTPASKTD